MRIKTSFSGRTRPSVVLARALAGSLAFLMTLAPGAVACANPPSSPSGGAKFVLPASATPVDVAARRDPQPMYSGPELKVSRYWCDDDGCGFDWCEVGQCGYTTIDCTFDSCTHSWCVLGPPTTYCVAPTRNPEHGRSGSPGSGQRSDRQSAAGHDGYRTRHPTMRNPRQSDRGNRHRNAMGKILTNWCDDYGCGYDWCTGHDWCGYVKYYCGEITCAWVVCQWAPSGRGVGQCVGLRPLPTVGSGMAGSRREVLSPLV
jgi:hypothetical protein